MTTIVLYGMALMFLIFSTIKDSNKTKLGLKKAWKSFTNILPELLSIMMFVGLSLAVLDPETISKIIGSESGLLGITIALIVGSITLIPSFVAFPLAAALLEGGAGYPQLAAFVSTLMGVGIITLSAEIKYFNKTAAILRNTVAFIISIIVTIVMGQVMN